MFFDDFIEPRRVISLSGASGVSRGPVSTSQRPDFLSIQLERQRAGKKLLRFLRHVLEFRNYVSELRDSLPEFLESAEAFLTNLHTRPVFTHNEEKAEGCVVPGSRAGGPRQGNPGNGITATCESAVAAELKTLGCDPEQIKSHLVSAHPVCRLLRIVLALQRYDSKNDYSEQRSRSLRIFRQWFTERESDESVALILDTPLLRVQFSLLCRRFLAKILPSVPDAEDHLGTSTSKTSTSQKQESSTMESYGVYLSSSSGYVPLLNIPADQGFSSWLEAQRSSGTPLPSFSTLTMPLTTDTPKEPEKSSSKASNETISTQKTKLEITRDPLSSEECDEIYFVVTLLGLLTTEELGRVCEKHEIVQKWYPSVLARAFVNAKENRTTFNLLLSIKKKMKEHCKSKHTAVQLLINFWVATELRKEVDKLPDVLMVVDATIVHGFMEGLCYIGTKPLEKTEFGPSLPDTAASKQLTEKIETVTKNLEKSLKSEVSLTMSLNSENWSRVCGTLKSQVEAILKAPAFLAFTNEITSKDESIVSKEGRGSLDREIVPENTGARAYKRDATVRNKCYVYHRLFTSMFNLLEHISSMRDSSSTRQTLKSVLSVMIMCLQFIREQDRKAFCNRHKGYAGLLGKVFYSYNGDASIGLYIVFLIAPFSSWDYFTPDMDIFVVSSCKTKLECNYIQDDPWLDTPKMDSHVVNLLVSCGVPLLLAKQFKKHYEDCCNSSFNNLARSLCPVQSNNGVLSYLWQVFSMVFGYCLKIMYDSEIIGKEGTKAIFDIDYAVFLANTLNYFYWNQLSSSKKKVESRYQQGENFPGNYVCCCNLDVEINPLFHATKNSPFDHVYWGTLASKFNERFFRIHDPESRSMLIPEVELAVLAQMKYNNLESPVMSVVKFIPNTVSFETRLELFIHYVEEDRRLYWNDVSRFLDTTVNIIRRNYILEDAMYTMGHLNGPGLKQPFKVLFVDETGTREEGVDGGGLFKEFVTSVCSVVFNPAYGIFEESPYDRSFVPSSNSALLHDDHLMLFRFVGKLIGKALYEGILIEPVLSRLMLNIILKHRNTLDDFKLYDPELYRNLTSMRQMSTEDIDSLGLTFTTGVASLDNSAQAEIIKGGSKMKVNKDNLESFIHHFADFKCNRVIEPQCTAFLQGLSTVIPLEWLRIFSPKELVYLISGSSEDIDLADMKENTLYSGGYTDASPVITWFWEIMEEFDTEMRRVFLWFVTCCKRAPLLGFKQLQPKFCITRDSQMGNMPTVSTCTNLLKLPEYRSKEELKAKLVDAMTMSKGFGLA